MFAGLGMLGEDCSGVMVRELVTGGVVTREVVTREVVTRDALECDSGRVAGLLLTRDSASGVVGHESAGGEGRREGCSSKLISGLERIDHPL